MSSDGSIRIALLGLAHMHGWLWGEAFAADPSVCLARIWDVDAMRGLKAAQRFRSVFETDLATTLEAVDAVAITSETADHERLIAAAAAAGKAILCEKPLALDLAQARRVVRCVERASVVFMQSFPKRFDPVNHALLEVVASGELGVIRLARVRHGHNHGLDPQFAGGWWTDPTRSGGGTLLDEGVHAADLLRWLFGPPADVTAVKASTAGLDVEDLAVAIFRWPDGMIGEIVSGWTMQAADDSIEIYGTRGTAIVSGVDLASKGRQSVPGLRVCAGGAARFEHRSPPPSFAEGGFHQAVAQCFASILRRGDAPPVGIADGLGAQAMIDAAYKAARSGRRMRVEPIR